MPKFHFAVGDISDGPVSATAGVEADSIGEALARLTDFVTEAEVRGAPPGVIALCTEEGLQVHVRVTQDAIDDLGNWDSDDGEIEEPTKLEVDYGGVEPEKAKKYLEDSDHCPYCGSGEIEGDSVDISNGCAFQDVRCLECSRSWRDEYKLVHVEGDRPSADDGVFTCTGCADRVEATGRCGGCGYCNSCCACG